jgi:hypothetical protein
VKSALQVGDCSHVPALHRNPDAQSAATAHAVLQPVAPHAYGTHDVALTGLQLPLPSQVAVGVKAAPLHDGEEHSDVGNVHPPRTVPSHFPLQTPVPAQAPRAPWGAPVTVEQVPTFPVRSHASHLPVQSASQQTPSVQKPEPHSLLAAHPVPSGLLQVPGLPAALHTSGGAQLEVLQQTPSTQFPELQSPAAVHAVPIAPFWQAPAVHTKPRAQSPGAEHPVLQVASVESHA